MIDVGALRALQSVATLGTVARAADELGYTASAVSQQIKRLERDLGTSVLAASGRGVVLTPSGRAVVNSASDVFDALERCAEAARSVSSGPPRGVIRLAAFSTAIRGLVAPELVHLGAQCPEVRVEVTEHDPQQAIHCVAAGTADLALIHDVDGLPGSVPTSVVRRQVYSDFGDVVVHRAHPLAQTPAPLSSADLIGHAWVTSPPGTVCHRWFRRLFADSEHEPDVRHSVDDFSTQLALVETSGVVALIPRLARPPLSESLVSLPLRHPPKRAVHAVWRRSADASPAINAVLAILSAP